MKNSTLVTISLVTTAIITVSAAVAIAGESAVDTTAPLPGIQDAIEIALSTGYAHGVGSIDGSSYDVEDLAGAGKNVELQAGYRITPNLAVLAYGSITDHSDGDALTGTNSDVFSATTGLMAAWHFRPTTAIDPWVSLGSGVRYLGIDAQYGNDRNLFGIDAARVQTGIDVRVSRMFSIGPVIGASVTKFVWDERMNDGWNEIDDRETSFHVSAGVMGRFDGPVQ
jgi:hypothetical protein